MVMVNGREGVVQWFCPCTALERVNTWIWYFELFTSTVQHVTNSITEAHVPTRDVQNSFEMGRDTASTCYLVSVMLMFSHTWVLVSWGQIKLGWAKSNKSDGFGSDVEKIWLEGFLVELDEAVVKIALSQHEIRIYESLKILLLLLPEPLL